MKKGLIKLVAVLVLGLAGCQAWAANEKFVAKWKLANENRAEFITQMKKTLMEKKSTSTPEQAECIAEGAATVFASMTEAEVVTPEGEKRFAQKSIGVAFACQGAAQAAGK